jgi:small-conductance mechanosensitive channel
VLGIAARPAAESLIAGLQVALTEPFHIDDVVIVEGEWGRIEEITSTYVVVGIWDRRRLVVPLGYFLQKPFQNWTRSGTDLLAQVTVEVDYSTPIATLREQVGEIVASSKLWNREFWNLQVTEAGERTMRLRILATAADADSAWNLRCEIREKLITYLQEHHPLALPRSRVTLEGSLPPAS